MTRQMTVGEAAQDPTTGLGRAVVEQRRRNEIVSRLSPEQRERVFAASMQGPEAYEKALREEERRR